MAYSLTMRYDIHIGEAKFLLSSSRPHDKLTETRYYNSTVLLHAAPQRMPDVLINRNNADRWKDKPLFPLSCHGRLSLFRRTRLQ